MADLAAAWPDEPWTPGFVEGAQVAAVCESMERSVAERRWVSVSEITGEPSALVTSSSNDK